MVILRSNNFWATVCKTVRPMLSDVVCQPNGCTDQDETWHVGRPRLWPHCVRWGPRSPPHVYCGKTAGWMELVLGMEVGLSVGDFVLEQSPQIFGPCLLWANGWMDHDATWHEGRPQPRLYCVKGPAPPQHKRREGAQHTQFSAHVY